MVRPVRMQNLQCPQSSCCPGPHRDFGAGDFCTGQGMEQGWILAALALS